MPHPKFVSLQAAVFAAAFCINASAADWPQFRGPARTGHVAQDEKFPASLSGELKTLWKIKIGEGFSSPVVAGGKLAYFDNQGGKETAHVLNADTKEELWSAPIDDVFKDAQGPPGSRCTPVIDGDRVYFQSGKGELQCRSLNDGKVIWRTNYTNDFSAVFIGEKGTAPGAHRHGYNGSPLIHGQWLYATVGGKDGESIVCFDKATGKVRWKSQNDPAAYAPPVMATIHGVEQVVVFTADGVIGVKSDDGKLLWRFPVKTAYSRHVTAPVVLGDLVMVSSHQVGLLGLKISKSDSGQSVEQAWLSKEAAMNVASPVLVGQHLYGVGPAKDLVCVNAADGKLAWSQKGVFTSSADRAHGGFIVMGEKILCLTDSGELVLFAADPKEYRALGRVQVSGATWCSPAYANGRLYLRDGVKGPGDLMAVEVVAAK